VAWEEAVTGLDVEERGVEDVDGADDEEDEVDDDDDVRTFNTIPWQIIYMFLSSDASETRAEGRELLGRDSGAPCKSVH